MTRRFTISILLLGLFNFLTAQDIHKKNSISFSPLNMFDIINPSLQFGYERLITENLSVNVEYGQMKKHSITDNILDLIYTQRNSSIYTNKGYKFVAETKYYYKRAGRRGALKVFFGIGFSYLKNSSVVSEAFTIVDTNYVYPFDRSIGQYRYYDDFTVNRIKRGVNIKYGFRIGNKFFVEPQGGLGVVYRTNTHSGRTNPRDEQPPNDFLSGYNNSGKKIILNLPLNVKVGYFF